MHAFVSASAALPGIGYSMEIFFHVGKFNFDSRGQVGSSRGRSKKLFHSVRTSYKNKTQNDAFMNSLQMRNLRKM